MKSSCLLLLLLSVLLVSVAYGHGYLNNNNILGKTLKELTASTPDGLYLCCALGMTDPGCSYCQKGLEYCDDGNCIKIDNPICNFTTTSQVVSLECGPDRNGNFSCGCCGAGYTCEYGVCRASLDGCEYLPSSACRSCCQQIHLDRVDWCNKRYDENTNDISRCLSDAYNKYRNCQRKCPACMSTCNADSTCKDLDCDGTPCNCDSISTCDDGDQCSCSSKSISSALIFN